MADSLGELPPEDSSTAVKVEESKGKIILYSYQFTSCMQWMIFTSQSKYQMTDVSIWFWFMYPITDLCIVCKLLWNMAMFRLLAAMNYLLTALACRLACVGFTMIVDSAVMEGVTLSTYRQSLSIMPMAGESCDLK